MKTKVIKQTGIVIGGEATLNLWGGGQGTIEMNSVFIPLSDISHNRIKEAINDGQFGCESIEGADIDIFIKYDNGSKEYERTIFVDKMQIPMNYK
jgi:hypothetical protein